MKNNNGFTLIEVMVSVLILSTGLLGLIGLQTAGLKNVVSSYNRTQASHFASEIADRIRANVADIKPLETGGTSQYKNFGADSTTATAKPNCQPDSNSALTGCSVAEMAENDVFQWNIALKDTRNGLAKTGKIEIADVTPCPNTTPLPFKITITLSWGENRDDDKDKDHKIDEELSFVTIFEIPRDPC